MRRPDTALIIAGHGSTENPDSSAPTRRHAEEIRRRGIFDEVECAFWKEAPGFHEACQALRSPTVYVVPNFISEGYFTREVIPRELRLGPDSRSADIDGRRINYCDPVGLHPDMTQILLKCAAEVAPDAVPEETTLIIVGHGTGLNSNSRAAIEAQVTRIRLDENARYAAVHDAYMEEIPRIAEWDSLAETSTVIVLPFFVADGLHGAQDIPLLLGIENDSAAGSGGDPRDILRRNPFRLRDHELFYAGSIGTDPAMTDIILDQVREFDRD